MNIDKPQSFSIYSLDYAFETILNSLYREICSFDHNLIIFYGLNGLCYFSYSKNYKTLMFMDYLLFEPLEQTFKITSEAKNDLISKCISSKFGLTVEHIEKIC